MVIADTLEHISQTIGPTEKSIMTKLLHFWYIFVTSLVISNFSLKSILFRQNRLFWFSDQIRSPSCFFGGTLPGISEISPFLTAKPLFNTFGRDLGYTVWATKKLTLYLLQQPVIENHGMCMCKIWMLHKNPEFKWSEWSATCT